LAKQIVSCHTANYKPVKQEVNGTVILPPLLFPDARYKHIFMLKVEEQPDSFLPLLFQALPKPNHGQTLAYRTSLGPSFQL
jgi:hypothetical protein